MSDELSTPLTLGASEFRLVRFGSTPLVHRFGTGDGVVLVGFESVAHEDVGLQMPPRPDAVLDAGEDVSF